MSVMLVAIGIFIGSILSLISVALCSVAKESDLQNENEQMRRVIRQTHDDIEKLPVECLTRNQIIKEMYKITERLEKALGEGNDETHII